MGPANAHLHTFSRVDVVWDGASGVIEVPEPWDRLWGETCTEERVHARERAWPVNVELTNSRGEPSTCGERMLGGKRMVERRHGTALAPHAACIYLHIQGTDLAPRVACTRTMQSHLIQRRSTMQQSRVHLWRRYLKRILFHLHASVKACHALASYTSPPPTPGSHALLPPRNGTGR